MEWLYRAAREEGKYRALGGHKAQTDYTVSYLKCTVCGRRVTEGPGYYVRHAPVRKGKKA